MTLQVLLHRRLPWLLTHGLCHLLGYTHNNDDDAAVMEAAEQHILQRYDKEAGPQGIYL